jgi:hypothetical protein
MSKGRMLKLSGGAPMKASETFVSQVFQTKSYIFGYSLFFFTKHRVYINEIH